jgi:hypothetical protein
MASAGGMSGAISAAGSLAPPWRTTIFRGAPSGADAVRWRRFVVPLAEPASAFFFAAFSGGICTATGAVSAVAFSAGPGATGACPAAFAEPAGSGCREAIPAAGKLNQSAIASPQASRITTSTGLFPTVAKNARVGASTIQTRTPPSTSTAEKTGEAFPPPRLLFRPECSLTRCRPTPRQR